LVGVCDFKKARPAFAGRAYIRVGAVAITFLQNATLEVGSIFLWLLLF
jgi:hypothetical protein